MIAEKMTPDVAETKPEDDPHPACEVQGSTYGFRAYGHRFVLWRHGRKCKKAALWLALFPCGDRMTLCQKHRDDIVEGNWLVGCDHDGRYSGADLVFEPVGRGGRRGP